MTVEAYPLHWPAGWKRIKWNSYREDAQFQVSMAQARDEMIAEIHRLVGKYAPDPMIIVSTNIELRQDGLPYANRRAPEDPGVAVYFMYKKSQRVFACDKYKKVEHNIRAIGKTIEAMRGIERWGASDMLERAFQGFEALPDLSITKTWRATLGVGPLTDFAGVTLAFKRLRSIHHPDNGGDEDEFDRINKAYEQAKKEFEC